ncbi:transglycosylase SLT domain-containing protein [Streptacidiphilus sp. P02-A3a]|uniref:transglycosylase SLT domain-containing protein n=1 Tax=Streptacidiphilus sp. P02-A3a TaxID=2704468 RepID=UPI0015FE7E8E|nr:transglycosylase SLT domain-containing protein [Streptacidiphilus sp. P02-A3a]QMU71018.1 transglycosylase SLT domain-containing protein [Streptacidiphilus sp. P02-A3a]
MAEQQRRWGWLALVAAVVVIGWAAQHGGHGSGASGTTVAASAGPSGTRPSPGGSGHPAPSASASPDQNVPSDFAAPVVEYARQAGIDPQLLMAILYNESYKPHDPAFQKAWLRLKPGAALGIANMHEAAYDETRTGRGFADRGWLDLADDPGLAIEAAAWYLHDLAAQLPAHPSGGYTEDQLLAMGYNAGASNMLAFARGVTPGSLSQTYLDTLRQNWDTAGQVVKPYL